MFDDRVCPSCQVLLRDGTRICPKCGRAVEPAKTGLPFLDVPGKIFPWLARRLGPAGAGVVAAAVFLILFLAVIGLNPTPCPSLETSGRHPASGRWAASSPPAIIERPIDSPAPPEQKRADDAA